MSLVETGALVVVLLAGFFLLALGSASVFLPGQARRFLLGFARSSALHFSEMFVRLIVGAGFVIHAPRMMFSEAFSLFGWLLLGTTACLLVIPWQWHRRFAERAVPLFTRYIAAMGLVSIAMGGLIIASVAFGVA